MQTKWKNRKLLQRYIITYFLVFAVPLVIFSCIVYRKSIETFSKQYIEITKTAANGVSVDLERLLEAAESTANTVRDSPYFLSSNIKDFAGAFIYIDQTMLKVSSLNKDFFQIAFYSAQSDLVYTDSIYNRKFYFDNIFSSEKLNSETDYSNISEPKWIAMQPVSIGDRTTLVSTLIVPVERGIKNGERTTSSVLLAHLDIERIRQILGSIIGLPDTHAIVFYDGVPILADDLEILQSFSTKEISAMREDKITFRDSEYMLKWNNQNKRIAVLTLLPMKNIQLLASDVLKTYLLSLLISVIIGSCLVFFGAWQNYRPLLRLFQKAASVTGVLPDKFKSLDEVDRTSYALDNLVESKTKAETAHREMKLEHILLRLLENSTVYSQQASFQNHLNELNINFDAKSYCCILFSQCKNRDLLVHTLMGYDFECKEKLFCIGDIDENGAIALICCEEANKKILNGVLECAKGMFGCAGIGNFVEEISDITVSYTQAYHASISTKEGAMIREYNNLQTIHENDILTQFSKEAGLFASAVARREQSKMLLSLSRISDLLELLATKESIGMLLHHILFVGIKSLAAANIPFSATLELFEDKMQSDKTTGAKNWLQAFSAHLMLLLNKSEKECTPSPASVSMKDVQYALLYINSNYALDTFSIKQLADEMGMSISNLSHFFKSKMNINISDYINDMRIAQAKRLLSETDLKISEIYPMLGYSHASSFTKNFKQNTGMTPSQYKDSVSPNN